MTKLTFSVMGTSATLQDSRRSGSLGYEYSPLVLSSPSSSERLTSFLTKNWERRSIWSTILSTSGVHNSVMQNHLESS